MPAPGRHHPGPFTAEQRLVRKLGQARLFDLLFVQVDAGAPTWRTVQQAAAILRDHHETAVQRHRRLRQQRLNQTGPHYVEICDNCFKDHLAEAVATPQGKDAVECGVTLDLVRTRAQARAWSVTAVQLTAVMLAHERSTASSSRTGVRRPPSRQNAGWPASSATPA